MSVNHREEAGLSGTEREGGRERASEREREREPSLRVFQLCSCVCVQADLPGEADAIGGGGAGRGRGGRGPVGVEFHGGWVWHQTLSNPPPTTTTPPRPGSPPSSLSTQLSPLLFPILSFRFYTEKLRHAGLHEVRTHARTHVNTYTHSRTRARMHARRPAHERCICKKIPLFEESNPLQCD